MDGFLQCDEVWEMSGYQSPADGRLEFMDKFLLCDEVWDESSSPSKKRHEDDQRHSLSEEDDEQYCQDALSDFLDKELKYMPGQGYVHVLESNHFAARSRSKAIQWLIHSQRRFNISIGTVFSAVNFVDRFIYANQCHGWKRWMMELLSVASFSIACKFAETNTPSLHEIQEGLECFFEVKLIQRMELKILKALGWELNCTTPHSYAEFIALELNSLIKPLLLDDLVSRLNELLLASLFENKLLVFRPCVIAACGIRIVLQQLFTSNCKDYLAQITNFIPQDQTENLLKCYNVMEEISGSLCKNEANNGQYYPSSPDTVLPKQQVNICDGQVDLSLFDGPESKGNNLKLTKRKREEDENCAVVKHQRCLD